MAGMEGLGRVFNVVPIITSGPAISLNGCSAVSFVITGSTAVPTLTFATSFGGTYRASNFFTPALVPITRVYWSTATDGTVAWSKATITAAATYTHGTTTGLTTATASVFTVFGSELPDPYTYIKCTVTGSGVGAAILHDLTVARAPASLAALSA
jgi:hypothetical protein